MNYIQLKVDLDDLEPWRDIFIAQLADIGYESFVETKTGFLGYITETLYQKQMTEEVLSQKTNVKITTELIEQQNWNHEWEKNFDPVFVDNKLAIVAPFHEVPTGFREIITIMPKMSFGTGHHQTTWLASQLLFDLDLQNKDVLDMGTGTGILAILAEKLGAKSVFAPDIDEWSVENAKENVLNNNCKKISVELGSDDLIRDKIFHIIIANINKNVLIQHFSVYSTSLTFGGKLLISGFFETDKEDLVEQATKHGFIFENMFTKEGWALIQFTKK